jgi:hypothetical protein
MSSVGDVVEVADVIEGHVVLNVRCLDRLNLNGYVPNLQVSGQVVSFMTAHLKNPIPSPAIMEQIGTRFRNGVERFAAANQVPVFRFGKDDRKQTVMAPFLARQAANGVSGVAAIGGPGVQRVWTGTRSSDRGDTGNYVWHSFARTQRRVTARHWDP